MAIPKFLEDLLIISKLGDNPGSDNGLSSSDLRAKFDEAGVKIQQYINNTLIPALSELADPTAGLNMKGNISMGGHRVTGLGEPVENGDAVPLGYVRKIGNPHNLLDNSDFRNPVNQRGNTSYRNGGYCIDRWFQAVTHATNINSDGVAISDANEIYGAPFRQKIPYNKTDMPLTFAVCDSDDVITIVSGIPSSEWTVTYTEWGTIGIQRISNDLIIANIEVNYGNTHTFRWAALYEGNYTAETLPKYQPKGYGAELAECQRYYIKLGNPLSFSCVGEGNNSIYPVITLPVSMRITPSFSGSGDCFGITNGLHSLATSVVYVYAANGHSVQVRAELAGDTTQGSFYAGYVTKEFALSADL